MSSTRIAKETAQTETRQLAAYWKERLGATFKVGPTGLPELEALDDQLGVALAEETTASSVLDGKRTVTNGVVSKIEKLRVRLRREVDNEFGANSPEAKAFPGGTSTSGSKKTETKTLSK